MKTFVITTLLWLATIGVKSQIILHLQVNPSNPSNSDVVNIVAPISFFDGCLRLDSTVFQSGTSFLITACYDYGWGSAGQVWRDTAHYHLGVLPNGTYTVKYIVHATQANVHDTLCNNYSLLDSTTKTFTIGPVGIEEVEDFSTAIFPNPVVDQLHLRADGARKKSVSAFIFNAEGQLVNMYTSNLTDISTDVSQLPLGLYFIRLNVDEQEWVKKFVKY